MKVLIIGLGSAAKKHIFALKKIDRHVEIFALRSSSNRIAEDGITNIYNYTEITPEFDFAIISNPSSLHSVAIDKLISFGFPLFIEKPVFVSTKDTKYIVEKLIGNSIKTYVACNLRFHPAIEFLKKTIEIKSPIEFTVYCGSYLPEWRPNQDYKKSYSANKNLGGGVNLDLIHEIDYTIFLLGHPTNVQYYLSKKSDLIIDTPDIAHYVFEYKNLSAFITLNYYRIDTKRTIDCVFKDDTWAIDLIKNLIINSKNEIIFSSDYNIMDTYEKQMSYFLYCINNDIEPMNNLEEAIRILKTCVNE